MFQVIAHHYANNDFVRSVETVILETHDSIAAHRYAAMNTSCEVDHENDAIASNAPFIRARFEVRCIGAPFA